MESKFTSGSIFRHIVIMTASSAVGLASLFLVDLVDMYWLSLLGEVELAAAVGYAGAILFFSLSLSIGLSIGCSALLSHAIGAGDKCRTKHLTTHLFLIICAITCVTAVVFYLAHGHFLDWLGATDKAHELASDYLKIVIPSIPVLALAMGSNGVLRAMGSAKNAMWITLLGGFVNAVLDPFFIFTLDMGIEGAAVATVCARFAMIFYGFWLVGVKAQLFAPIKPEAFRADLSEYLKTAIPAALTNLSTPIGVAYVTALMATFGDGAVAGNAVISRLQPLAFAGLFALSGSIGPIAGQNLGAKLYPRILEVLQKSLLFIVGYCCIACLILFISTDLIVAAFKADGEAEELIRWFCYGLSAVFLFNGVTFVTNALFNNLKAAHIATQFNFAKATIGTIPFAYAGAEIAGPIGILIGVFIGSILIAALGLYVAYRKINALQSHDLA